MCNQESSVMSLLKSVFGYEDFKNDVQKEAIVAICEGSKYVCISMPPGFGRSLCFQLPALLCKGKVGIVFSPKLSFIKKEIEFLKSKQINVGLLYKGIQINERNNILNNLKSNSPTIVLLYATLEMDTMTYFKQLIVSLKERMILSYIVFNEAHCLSELGYDYTPCYKRINTFDKIYEYIPKIAVTTTVTDEVIQDICKQLTLKTPKIFKMPVQQINVHYDMWFIDILSHPFDHLKSFIIEVLGFLDLSTHKTHKGFAIVYCREVITAELLKTKLYNLGIPTLIYHHKLKNSTRHNIENNWIFGQIHVIITTYDYGFIHKRSIRCIVYWTVPENIAKYYRESAQIDSSNGNAYCRIYFSVKEYSAVQLLIKNHRVMNNSQHIQKRLDEYEKMISYCLSVKYFGYVTSSCKMNCDVCKNEEAVGIRTLKFITYSEHVEGVKYSIADVNENLKEQSKDILEVECKISKTLSKIVIMDDDNDKQCIEQFNEKLVRNKRKRSFAESISLRERLVEDCNQTSTRDTVKRAKDNSVAIETSKFTITNSLLDKYNLDKGMISLEPCCSKDNISNSFQEKRTINTGICNDLNESINESGIEIFKDTDEIKAKDRKNDILSQNSPEIIIIEEKWSDKKQRKRSITADTCPEDFKPKRRKLNAKNKPTTETAIQKNKGNAADSCVEHIKDDLSGNATRDHAMVEYLMNKYQLNRHSITLIPRKK
ncbi:ATP-dependent DNA helicase Q5 [Eufriesea mexicana]|nr:ATP-dependent DNA helicase Q5 [Eufriesea mexicana]